MRWAHEEKTTTDVAEYWNERPCNVRHSQATIGSCEYFAEVAQKKYAMEPHIPGFANFIRWQGKSVLEIGCGIGTDTTNFIRHGAWITAVDVSRVSVSLARRNARCTHQYTYHIEQADVQSVLFTDRFNSHWDLIYSFGVLHHTPRPDLALDNLRALADADTELRIMLYYRWSSKAMRLGLTDRRVARGSEAQPDSPVTYAFSRRKARALLEASGWEVQYMWVDHIFPWKGDEYGRGEYVKGLPWRYVPDWLFRKLSHVVGWHLMIVAKPIRNSEWTE